MSRFNYFCLLALIAALPAQAAVSVVNNDGVAHEFKVQCKSDPAPVDEWVDPRGVVDLQNGPCTFAFANGQTIVVPDKEAITITGGKAVLQ
jgi:hypothetical protein